MSISVVIVDSHTLLRDGLRAVLAAEVGLCVVGDADDARSAYAAVDACEPDVVLMAIELRGVDGIAATREILRRRSKARVIIVSTHEGPEFLRQATAAGADGYVLKSQTASELAFAIRTVHAGDPYVAPALAATVARRRSDQAPSPVAVLSPREREVFSLVVQGFTNDGVAKELSISVKTVETHRTKINRKLDVHSSADLVRFAVAHGLVG